MSVTPAPGRLRQENCVLEDSLGYIVRSSKNKLTEPKEQLGISLCTESLE